MEKLTVMDMYELCNEKEWFTCGTSRQYEKMFDYVRDANINSLNSLNYDKVEKIATMIWICSENVTALEITHAICKLFRDKNNIEW